MSPRSESMIHDCAWAMAHALMSIVGHCFREEEQRDLFAEFYTASREDIEAYRVKSERMMHWINPSKN